MPPEPFGGLNAGTRNARRDVAAAQAAAVGTGGIAFVSMELHGTAPRPPSAAPHGWHGIDQRQQLVHVGTVGRRETYGERMAGPVNEEVVFAACFGAIRRVRPRLGPLLVARTLEESAEARLQSIRPCLPSASKSTWCSCAQTPAACQSRSRRQHVMPQTPKTSRGSASHWIPVFSTKMMPRRHARSSAGGRPPLGRGGCGGSNG